MPWTNTGTPKIPRGWRVVTRGTIHKGDKFWRVNSADFFPVNASIGDLISDRADIQPIIRRISK